MLSYLKRRQVIGIAILLGSTLVLLVALVGLFRTTLGPARQADSSHIVRIVREMNGYRVYWTGSAKLDAIAAYDVQVCRVPCEAWQDWKMGTTETSAWFGPDEGKQFGFRVRAHTAQGTSEPWPAEISMTTEQARP